MKIETENAIYEDTFNSLVAVFGAVSGAKSVYECSCGEKSIHHMELFSTKDKSSYQYNYICGCGNKIKVYVKDIHAKI